MANSKTPTARDQEISFEIKFHVDCDPADGSAVFKAGKVYELPASSANHWIRRNKAIKYVPKPKAKPAPVTTPKRATTAKRKYTPRKKAPAPKSTVVIPEEKKTPDGASPEAELKTDS